MLRCGSCRVCAARQALEANQQRGINGRLGGTFHDSRGVVANGRGRWEWLKRRSASETGVSLSLPGRKLNFFSPLSLSWNSLDFNWDLNQLLNLTFESDLIYFKSLGWCAILFCFLLFSLLPSVFAPLRTVSRLHRNEETPPFTSATLCDVTDGGNSSPSVITLPPLTPRVKQRHCPDKS